MKMEEYGTEHGLILKAPSTKGAQKNWQFNCSGGWVTDLLHLYDDFHHSSYEITRDGRLHGYNISYQDPQGVHLGNFSWDNDKFCVGYADLDYDYVPDGEFQLTFNACFDDSPACKDHLEFLSYFNPISLCISIFFLLLTIGVIIWYKNINHWDRSNMMKIAFLVNLTLAYIVR